ncbi:hypothetical protein HYH03_016083 [Edaphochlamys debaryana]|uniref:Uncharacterized protein n=1 Tax=Edaphochlamys debaryana TaxID=47281 RepID=A0A835XSG4_9CHLO|nr:hypothetical protein HYH03_016083 [Edaphochlamys debaryana]|eukprot:KAG2485194.1 hypothetical protein HYH03_016083 [Edaphochlamys debaryana]
MEARRTLPSSPARHAVHGHGLSPIAARIARQGAAGGSPVKLAPVAAIARPSSSAISGSQTNTKKDMTAEVLERVFKLALAARLKQHGGVHVDVRTTALGLVEGKFGGMTVRGSRWRTPLELTAEQLMVDVGEMALDLNKLLWQQAVTLKNVPQGSVSFTLTSADLANFMAHPLMRQAAARAVGNAAFNFDRSTARVRFDPASGRGIITYEGVWAANGQRYAVTMSTPPAVAASSPPSSPRGASSPRGVPSPAATSTGGANTMDQLTVSARRVGGGAARPAAAAAGGRSATGSAASAGSSATSSTDDAGLTAAAASGGAVPRRPVVAAASVMSAAAAAAGSLDDAAASGSSSSCSDAEEAGAAPVDPSEGEVAEGLRRFFSGLMLNLQGIELRQPALTVQLPAGPAPGFAAAATPLRAAAAAPASPAAPGPEPLPAWLTISMRVRILSLPPLNMSF